ncbi:MAG: hypothetical protein LBG60_12340, partial [Bifidobacteriaceae bacterium]|jgi:hypothetical protein|nr:hypothetical protein [Bifidobacteriaceae bacterium]
VADYNAEGDTTGAPVGAFALTPGADTLLSNYTFEITSVPVTVVQPIIISFTAAAGDQVTLNQYFDNAYTLDWGDDSALVDSFAGGSHVYAEAGEYSVTLTSKLTHQARRWTFVAGGTVPLAPTSGTDPTDVVVEALPKMRSFMESDTAAGDAFFASFNRTGKVTALPDGSFDTSAIESVGDDFFRVFNTGGQLTELPDGSFKTGEIATVGEFFFFAFNSSGALTSLPADSFDISGIQEAGVSFFSQFNSWGGQLTSLPIGSFDTSSITVTGLSFFDSFNFQGALLELPAGSFDTSHITTAGRAFFGWFNYAGALTQLPAGSFDTRNISVVDTGGYFFAHFNEGGRLAVVPDSFHWPSLSQADASQQENFVSAFNSPTVFTGTDAEAIIGGCATPVSKRSTFSAVQPGYADVDPNWQA